MVENGILLKTGLLSRRLYLEGGLEFDSGCGEDAAVTTLRAYPEAYHID
jgi:hypothetical protein